MKQLKATIFGVFIGVAIVVLIAFLASCSLGRFAIDGDCVDCQKETETNTFVIGETNTNTEQTNDYSDTNISQQIVTNYVTNILIEYITNSTTNYIYDVITNYVTNSTTNYIYDVITNYVTNSTTNYIYDVITNYVTNSMTNYLTNVITNYVTNTVTNQVDNLEVYLTTPADGDYVVEFFNIQGVVSNTENLSGVILYVEHTNDAIVSAQYSTIQENIFSAQIEVDIEGFYYLWATAFDSDERMGKSAKALVIADWSAPFVEITGTEPCGCQGEIYAGTVTIYGIANDAVSGLQGVYLQVDGQGFYACDGLENWTKSLELNPGLHLIKVYSRDKAGYVSLMEELTLDVSEY